MVSIIKNEKTILYLLKQIYILIIIIQYLIHHLLKKNTSIPDRHLPLPPVHSSDICKVGCLPEMLYKIPLNILS